MGPEDFFGVDPKKVGPFLRAPKKAKKVRPETKK